MAMSTARTMFIVTIVLTTLLTLVGASPAEAMPRFAITGTWEYVGYYSNGEVYDVVILKLSRSPSGAITGTWHEMVDPSYDGIMGCDDFMGCDGNNFVDPVTGQGDAQSFLLGTGLSSGLGVVGEIGPKPGKVAWSGDVTYDISGTWDGWAPPGAVYPEAMFLSVGSSTYLFLPVKLFPPHLAPGVPIRV